MLNAAFILVLGLILPILQYFQDLTETFKVLPILTVHSITVLIVLVVLFTITLIKDRDSLKQFSLKKWKWNLLQFVPVLYLLWWLITTIILRLAIPWQRCNEFWDCLEDGRKFYNILELTTLIILYIPMAFYVKKFAKVPLNRTFIICISFSIALLVLLYPFISGVVVSLAERYLHLIFPWIYIDSILSI